MSDSFTLEPMGENALLLRMGDTLDEQTNMQVHTIADRIGKQAPAWLLDVVPAFASLAVCFDPHAFASHVDPGEEVSLWLKSLNLDKIRSTAESNANVHEIPVHYGDKHGPDLKAVAEHAGLDPAEIVLRHTASEYRVGMLGFAAGFPYLLGMHASLTTPRRATPRTRVAAGSVGIGGSQTGIYPREGPGGWQIIGYTDFSLFDSRRDPPSMLGPGDRVRFVDAGRNIVGKP